MPTNYTGVPGNVSFATAIQASIPADNDPDAASTHTPGEQKQIDYLEAFRQLLVLGSGLPINEGFENATFPPATPSGAWATPSPRFGTDSAWVRTTVGPLSGTASASAPTPQTLSTNSSLGFQMFFTTPSRLQFVLAVTCNANNGDHLDFYVDGVLTAQLSSTTGPTAIAGTFYTDCLREGLHTFDWRFVRGAAASVASEKCLIDSVQVISEQAWMVDQTMTRFGLFDYLPWGGPSSGASVSVSSGSGFFLGNWQLIGKTTNLPTVSTQSSLTGFVTNGNPYRGLLFVTLPGAASGDAITVTLPGNQFFTAAKSPFAEWRASLTSGINASICAEFGVGAPHVGTAIDFAGWALDGSVSLTGWRWRTRTSVGVQTDVDSGVAFTAGALSRLGSIVSTVGGITSAIFTKDGKALPGAGSIPPILVTNMPTTVAPVAITRQVGGAVGSFGMMVEWARILSLR